MAPGFDGAAQSPATRSRGVRADGATGTIYMLQPRPDTGQSRAGRLIERLTLKQRSTVLASRAARSVAASAPARHG